LDTDVESGWYFSFVLNNMNRFGIMGLDIYRINIGVINNPMVCQSNIDRLY